MNNSDDIEQQSREARETLQNAEARSRSAAARLPEHAPWYEAIWLAYIGALVLSMALPTPLNVLVIALLVFGLVRAMHAYQERYGVWVSGFRAGATRTIAAVLSGILAVILMAVWICRHYLELIWPVFPAAAIAVGISFLLGRLWMRAYRRETGQS